MRDPIGLLATIVVGGIGCGVLFGLWVLVGEIWRWVTGG